MIKIERKNKTEDGQVEIESQPDDKDDKKRILFSQVIFAGLRKWPFAGKIKNYYSPIDVKRNLFWFLSSVDFLVFRRYIF